MGGSMPPMSVFPRNKKRERRRAPLPFVVSELVGHPAPCRVDDPVDHRLTQCAIIPFIYGEVAQLIVLDDMLVEVAVKGPALCARNRGEVGGIGSQIGRASVGKECVITWHFGGSTVI